MEENEFYFEESNPRRTKIICLVIFVIIIVAIAIFMYYRNVYTLNLKREVVYEAGDTLSSDVNVYLDNKIIDEDDYTLSLINVPNENGVLTKVGEYTYRVKYKSITKKGKIVVEDNTPPKVETIDLTIGVDEEYDLDEFLTLCDDYSKPCITNYKDKDDANLSKNAGTYAFDLVISDQYKNDVTKTVKLEVKENFTRESLKKSDLTIHHIEPNFDDYNNELFIKYDEGVNDEHLDEDERYNELLELAGENLRDYLPDEYYLNGITETDIIFVYNKYNYVIGYAVRVTLDNGISLYLDKDSE